MLLSRQLSVILACTLAICCLASRVLAADTDYTCTIAQVYHLEELGTLEAGSEEGLDKEVKNRPFTVSRETGAITGKASELDTGSAKSTTVIHRGSGDNSFVAVADFGVSPTGTHAYRMIKIEEYRTGSSKPFVAMGDLTVVSGTCK